jgi:hypothetical protein
MASRHDEEVRKEIARLNREGFTDIKATVPGYDSPKPIEKDHRIPDIEATGRANELSSR